MDMIGYASDYMWRGVSVNLQGASSFNAGIELDSNGFFVGATWVGEVDYSDDDATQEKDLYRRI